jgi:hypothetical protein
MIDCSYVRISKEFDAMRCVNECSFVYVMNGPVD